MAMPSDYWQVVGDAFCNILPPLIEPQNEFLSTTNKFLMNFEAVIRRVTSGEAERILDRDIISRNIEKTASIELDDSSNMDAALSETLRQLHVPLSERSSMMERVMYKAFEAAHKPSPYANGKRLRMWVNIDIYVIDDNGDDEEANGGDGILVDYYEPRFVPASRLSIEKLESTRVQVSSEVCPVCMEEIGVGSDATKMPCNHLFHKSCIVDWLHLSAVCPLCRFIID